MESRRETLSNGACGVGAQNNTQCVRGCLEAATVTLDMVLDIDRLARETARVVAAGDRAA